MARRRVVVVGTAATAARAAGAIAGAGHDAYPHAVIETVALASPATLRDALVRLPADGLILLSSPAAVRHAVDGLGQSLRGRRAAVQGPGTAAEARGAGLDVVLEADVHNAEGMLAAIGKSLPPPGPGMLLFTAERGRGVLERGLRDAGYNVEPVCLYRTREIAPGEREPLPPGPLDVVIFTSPSAVRAFLAAEGLPAGAALVAMGSTTERELARAGLRADRIAGDYSVPGLVRMLESW